MKAKRETWNQKELQRVEEMIESLCGRNLGRRQARHLAESLSRLPGGKKRSFQAVISKYKYLRDKNKSVNPIHSFKTVSEKAIKKVRRRGGPYTPENSLESEIKNLFQNLQDKVFDLLRDSNKKDRKINKFNKLLQKVNS